MSETGKLDKAKIEKYLKELGERVANKGKHLDLKIFGGSAVALHYNYLRTTDDIDALFERDYEIE